MKKRRIKMKKMSIFNGVLAVLIAAPIWYYLLYQILVRVNASELMFFLYWVYLPVGLIGQTLAKIAESK